jgi:polysulfide reductase chain C
MYFIGLFTIAGAVHLSLIDWSGAGQSGGVYGLGILMAAITLLVTVYGGFVFNYINAIPLWNSPLIPILFVVGSFWGGAELALVMNIKDVAAEKWIQILLPSYILLLIIYILSVRHTTVTGKYAIMQIIRGRMAPVFFLGVVGIGILLPLSVIILNLIGTVSIVLIVIAVIGGLIGDLSMRYCILRCGFY